MIVGLAGGVGGAKLLQGLALALPDVALTAIVNTADDFELYGLHISPDLDTVLYTLAGLANPTTGWGIAGDTRVTLDAIARLGRDPWFILGDQDLATHILRSERLKAGTPLSAIMAEFASALGVSTTILPMTDDTVATMVDTPAGRLEFQEYFVHRHQEDDVLGVEFVGGADSSPAPGVLDAIAAAELLVLCPSNPIVSIGPILAVPGIREAIERASAPVVAVSPIVGGKALKGSAGKMMRELGKEVSARAVAGEYLRLIDGFVLDQVDAHLLQSVSSLGVRALATPAVMRTVDDRVALARTVLDFARTVRTGRALEVE
jgi:LPPG:FO 2-phospho-L-lactate transferase